MDLRPLQLTDLPDVAALYSRMLREDPDAGGYPHDATETPGDLVAWLWGGLSMNPDAWICLGAFRDATPGPFGEATGGVCQGVLLGQITRRPTGTPRDVGFCEWIYVTPESRGGKVAIRLMLAAAAELQRRKPGAVLEGGYRPGSHAERIWTKLGMRPYMIRCAFVDAQGKPRETLPIAARAARKEQYGVPILGRRRVEVPVVDRAVHALRVSG